MLISRPMFCGRLKSLEDLQYPLLCTPKVDGIRCLKVRGRALTRAFKPIPNYRVAALVEACLPEGIDGELVVPGADYSDVQSAIMSRDGKPDFKLLAFDWASEWGYSHRVNQLAALQLPNWCEVLMPTLVENEDEFLQFEELCLADGSEGVIARRPRGPYKQGRSTVNEGFMVKWKRAHRGEALVLCLVEAMENVNPQVPNAFGLMKRPGGRSGKRPKDTLGAFQVQDVRTGVRFEIGTGRGLTAALRQRLWDRPELAVGRVVSYEHQAVGALDRPRFPSFVGFRDD